jgi:outer membrane lipopolysaccharide assembly protein LptE/RlpB
MARDTVTRNLAISALSAKGGRVAKLPLPPEGGGWEGGSRKAGSLVHLFTLLVLLVVLGGCGYHSVAGRGPLGDANGVNVTVFANKSFRPGLEAVIARDLVHELAQRTGGKVVRGDEADLELTGTVLSYKSMPISYTALDTIAEYNAVVAVQAVLLDQRSRKVLWKGDLIGEQSYPVNDNIALQQNAEEAAIAAVSRRLSERIWQKIGERF